MSGGYATMEIERRYARFYQQSARFYQQSEMLRERHAGNLFEAQGGKLSAALGAHALELEGGSGHYRFRTRTELILIIAKLRPALRVARGRVRAQARDRGCRRAVGGPHARG